ncbi:hypothetical protein F9B16_30425 [Actinomadura montaniterrae]|uniref:Uncharacterized protein n=1 Tax=Actinomadura montaniterrae TaxID=1803903 RepID=A0A6L3VR53_9ACTN|nr:hypothetical protein F9B16_30425 [Actinomadura montaniterrae]
MPTFRRVAAEWDRAPAPAPQGLRACGQGLRACGQGLRACGQGLRACGRPAPRGGAGLRGRTRSPGRAGARWRPGGASGRLSSGCTGG